MHHPPIPKNELSRVLELAELDLDYSNLNNTFKDLTKLAASVAGTEISLLNLIDSFTQWTISGHGLEVSQIPREESICQYTIMETEQFEVHDLKLDERFKDKSYVLDEPKLSFYFGIPLKTKKGHSIGALCVLDKSTKILSPEKVELLKVIAAEIVNRLMAHQAIQSLQYSLKEAKETKKRVAHDIRGPLGGIIGLAQYISQKGDKNQLDEILEFVRLIQKSSTSLLELADEILNAEHKAAEQQQLEEHQLNLLVFKDKLEKLYLPQAKNKEVLFSVQTGQKNGVAPFPKNKLLQITGNLISNAIKFTPAGGQVSVQLELEVEEDAKTLHISVSDTGVGLTQEGLEDILNGNASSTDGTTGERGYGFGLPLVKYLIDIMQGSWHIHSIPGKGTTFEIKLPVK
ncbi:GAF domain-containing sensor histidine kinase [Pontibacter sp. SGAir0037]|uniref:GAF domain-containing sensor histidine kinase n=1 Tax=Pontibacter sp. SGAir0037 TaxID=2571030 RepID=UPI0010CD5DE9|nr:GAF domain-containing sensor histidine kinase [Pontibacter sp. SGAir0037]QCR21581.1 histidine kinase [Pontibacter sp. SGAir0037]